MRFIACSLLAAALLLPGAVCAQQISIAGWVDRVDAANATITIRTLAAPRTIAVAPNAVIRINGAASRFEQLPFNSPVSIVAEKDANGVLHAVRITVQADRRHPAAAAPPGAIVRGTLVGINVPGDTITVRTPSGDYPVTLGTASIYVNGAVGSSRDLRLGQPVEVDRTQPTPASTDFVTQTVRVLSSGSGTTRANPRSSAGRSGTAVTGARTAAGAGVGGSHTAAATASHLTGAGTVDRGYVRTRTRAYKSAYRARRRTRRPARRTRTRTRRRRGIRRTRPVTPHPSM